MTTMTLDVSDVGKLANTAVEEIGDFIVSNLGRRKAPRDLGTLLNSYHFTATGLGRATVSTSVFYAPFLEFGTRYMDAQPHLHPALLAAKAHYGGKVT